jgi:hypothetical protein
MRWTANLRGAGAVLARVRTDRKYASLAGATLVNYRSPTLKMKIKRFAILVFAASVNACSHDAATSAPQVAKQAAFDSVSLWRTACYGNCPIYHVEIRADGHVRFNGERFVKQEGEHEATLSRDDVQFLSQALVLAKFGEMRERYKSEKDGCTALYTDHPSVILAVERGGSVKTVVFDFGCRGSAVPETELRWLSDTIDVVGRTRQWVGD